MTLVTRKLLLGFFVLAVSTKAVENGETGVWCRAWET